MALWSVDPYVDPSTRVKMMKALDSNRKLNPSVILKLFLQSNDMEVEDMV